MVPTHAIVIIWNGNEPTSDVISAIGQVLVDHNVCIPECMQLTYKDCAGIEDSLLKDVINVQHAESQDEKAIKNAVIYIGERFKDSLSSTNRELFMFAAEIINDYRNEKRAASFTGVGSRSELCTAVEIIATTEGIIPTHLARKYHFDNRVIKIIKNAYKTY